MEASARSRTIRMLWYTSKYLDKSTSFLATSSAYPLLTIFFSAKDSKRESLCLFDSWKMSSLPPGSDTSAFSHLGGPPPPDVNRFSKVDGLNFSRISSRRNQASSAGASSTSAVAVLLSFTPALLLVPAEFGVPTRCRLAPRSSSSSSSFSSTYRSQLHTSEPMCA